MRQSLTQDQRRRFERLMWPLIPVVLRFARFLTHHAADADDLAQETMMRAMRNIDRFAEGTDAKAWLMTITRHLWIDRQRVKKHRCMASLDADDAPEPVAMEEAAGLHDPQWHEPEELLQHFGDQELIDALHTLPDEQRWAVLLVDVEGVEQTEAARILGVPTGTVKSRASRARAALRDHLYERAQARGWLTHPRSQA